MTSELQKINVNADRQEDQHDLRITEDHENADRQEGQHDLRITEYQCV